MIGAGTILGTFTARLGLDTSEYARGIINAETMNRVFGQSFAAFVASPLLGSLGLIQKVGSGLLNMGRSFVKYSGDVLGAAEATQRLAERTGATAELVQALERRLDLAGFASDRARQALTKLNQQAGAGNKVFEALGVDPSRFNSIDQLLGAVLDRLTSIEDQSLRTALAMQLFGEEAGPELMNAVGGGTRELARMVEEAQRLGLVLSGQTVRSLADLNTSIGQNQQAWEGLKLSVTAAFLEGIAGRSGEVSGNVTDITVGLRTELIPVARELGDQLSRVLDLITKILDKADRIEGAGNNLAMILKYAPRGAYEEFKSQFDDFRNNRDVFGFGQLLD